METILLNLKKPFLIFCLLFLISNPAVYAAEVEDDGFRREYYAGGQLLSETDCLEEESTGYYREFYENGNTKFEVNYPAGYLYGVYSDYCETGTPQMKLDYRNFQKNGVYTAYFENGKIQSTGEYLDGKATGLHQVYYPSGQLAAENEYSEGIKNGKGKTFYPEGALWEEYVYKDGLPEGKYRAFTTSGLLVKEVDYERGEVVRAMNYGEERLLILEVLKNKFAVKATGTSWEKNTALHQCISQETGIQFACDPDWKLKRMGRTLTITISEVPLVEMVVEESDRKIRFPHELTREALTDMGRYEYDFFIERFRHCDRETVKVNGRLKGQPGTRVSDFYMTDHFVLHSVKFTVAPEAAWEDYKWLVKEIVDSVQFIKQPEGFKFANEETDETCEELVK